MYVDIMTKRMLLPTRELSAQAIPEYVVPKSIDTIILRRLSIAAMRPSGVKPKNLTYSPETLYAMVAIDGTKMYKFCLVMGRQKEGMASHGKSHPTTWRPSDAQGPTATS